MRPYKLKSSPEGYSIFFAGILLREVSPFDDYEKALAQVNRANDLFDRQIRGLNATRSRVYA